MISKNLLFGLTKGLERNKLKAKELESFTPLFEQKILKDDTFLKLKSEFRVGRIEIIPSTGTGFLVQPDRTQKDLLIESYDLNGAAQGDLVIVKRLHHKSGRPKAKVIFIAHRRTPFVFAYLSEHKGRIVAYDMNTEAIVHLTTRQRALKPLPPYTVVKIDTIKNDIAEVIGVLTDPLSDEKIVLGKFGRQEAFSQEIINEVTCYGTSVDKSLYPERKDLTHLPFITIDPITAKDYDDAIYYDETHQTLYIAIADVTAYVHPFTALDEEARRRAFSIYFPHKSIPMLPRELSENLCSLNEKVDRLSFVCEIKLSIEGEIQDYLFYEAIIHSQKRFSYERVDELFAGKKASSIETTLLPMLHSVLKKSQQIRNKRLHSGFDFNTEDIRLHLNDDLMLDSTTPEEHTISHQLIEECMLLANRCAATLFTKGIFRIHESPSLKSIDHLIDNLREIGLRPTSTSNLHLLIESVQEDAKAFGIKEQVDHLLIKAMKRAEYSYSNSGHFGLGFEHYTHFTSPIRRYSDLILHRLLKAILHHDTKQERYLHQQLPEVTAEVSTLERETTKIMWEYDDRVFARWADANQGASFEARIVDYPADKPPIVKLDDTIKGARIFIDGPVPPCKLFDRVRVKILGANVATTYIYGQIIEVIPLLKEPYNNV